MKEFKGTKEKWVLDYLMSKGGNKCEWISIRNSKNHLIGQIKGRHYKIPHREMLANAKLMASAPELLEALQLLLLNGHSENSIDRAEKAINEALK